MVQTKFAGFREIYLMVTLNLTLRSTLGITQGQSTVLQIASNQLATATDDLSANLVMGARQIILKQRFDRLEERCVLVLRLLLMVLIPYRVDCLLVLNIFSLSNELIVFSLPRVPSENCTETTRV
ncbi:hypothetical protein G5I_01184 [Acromyrmex echinatior]|uniref:Uncharacterized protein n=1 Tax=Acromyrmex echinatior TaxID=103372 RepID=F4W6X7_ACREC|nr:hypothetical protein G5I_01184 [Acromyrmex echinatior]